MSRVIGLLENFLLKFELEVWDEGMVGERLVLICVVLFMVFL